MLAAGLLSLLRYGFGSLFVVGESVAMALLRSTGADIAGTVDRLHVAPLRGALEAGCGLILSAAAANLVWDAPLLAGSLAAVSAAEAWWFGMPLITALEGPAVVLAVGTVVLR